MAVGVEAPFVYAFSALLAAGAVVLLFVPLLRHVWLFSASRTVFVAVVASLLALSAAAVLGVGAAASDPWYFVPIAAITVVLRLASPGLLYRGIRDRYEGARPWPQLRILLGTGYVLLAGSLAYNLLLTLAGREPSDVLGISEQLAMAFGASALVVRTALRVRPKDTFELWPVWIAGTCFAIAFVVVAPYAFPSFKAAYLVSGLAGWIIGVLVVRFVD